MAFTTAAVLAGTSLALSAAGSYAQYKGEREQAKTATSVSEFNARLKENETIQSEMIASENVRRARAQNERTKSTQLSRIGASGVVANAGSPLEVIGYTAGQMELQVADMEFRNVIERDAGFAEADAIRYEGARTSKAARIASRGTIMSGVARLAGSGYGFYDEGAFN